MKTIEIENDIYEFLLKNTADFGETPSSVLRRLLDINGASPAEEESAEMGEVDRMLASTEFAYARGVVGRFLTILSALYHLDEEKFKGVEKIRGRGRIYFAQDRETLEKSGRSVNPKVIPGTEYWVITTTPTDLKQEILSRVLQLYGIKKTDIIKARTALRKGVG